MTTVYVVTVNEDYEGGRVQGVFSTRENAVAWCKGFMEGRRRHREWVVAPDGWRNGCDTLEIEEWQLDRTLE